MLYFSHLGTNRTEQRKYVSVLNFKRFFTDIIGRYVCKQGFLCKQGRNEEQHTAHGLFICLFEFNGDTYTLLTIPRRRAQ
jgi:hypothetical protein